MAQALDEVSKEVLNGFRSAHGLSKDGVANRIGQTKDGSLYESSSPDHGFQKLKRISPFFKTCQGPKHFTNVDFYGVSVGVCITSTNEVEVGELSLSANRWSRHFRIPSPVRVPDPIMSTAFVHDNKLYVMVADQGRVDGVEIKVFDKDFAPIEKSIPVVPSPYPTAMKGWKAIDGNIQLAVSSSPPELRRRSTYESRTKIYTWMETYFDPIADLVSYHVKDICPFTIGGKEYVILINYEMTPTVPEVDSPVYQFDFDNDKLVLIQTLRLQGAVDCETFILQDSAQRSTSTKTLYLAIANHRTMTLAGPNYNTNSVIYRFSHDRFVPFQVIPTTAATQIKAYEDPSISAFVLAVSDSNGVRMYQYNGWKFLPASVQSREGSLGPGVLSITVGTIGAERFLIASNPRTVTSSNVIRLEFEKNEVLKNWRIASLGWCSSARAVDVNKELDKLDQILNGNVFYVNQPGPIHLQGDLHLEAPNVVVKGLLSAPYVFNHEDNSTLSHGMTHELEALEKKVLTLEKRVQHATSLLAKALRLDVPDQLVTGQYTFENLDVTCGPTYTSTPLPGEACNIASIITDTLNGKNVIDIGRQVIRIDRDQTINHPNLTFQHIESSSDLNLLGDGLVNGVNISHLVSKSGRHYISSPVTFAAPVTAGSIEVAGKVNGIKLNNQTILLKNGDQTISSEIEFTSPVKATNIQVSYVNGRPFGPLLSNIVTVDGNHVIKGKKTFKLIDVKGQLNINSTISGVDLPRIHDNLLWANGEQQISSNVNLDELKVRGNLNIRNGINGISLSGQEVVLNRRTEPIVVIAPKTFTSPLTKVDHLHIKGTLNGIGLVGSAQGNALSTEWPEQLDILLKSRSQSIPVKKTVAGSIHLHGHSTVQGNINDVDLSALEKTVLKHSESNFLSGPWSFNGPVQFRNSVTVRGNINGVNVSNLYYNSLRLDERSIPNMAQKFVFSDAVIENSLACGSINGLVLERDLMTKNTEQIITGVKTFNEGLHIKNDFTITGTFNGLSMQFLQDSLLSSTYQVVQGPKIVQGDLYVNNLFTKSLNGINLASELILLNSTQPQMISGRKNLRQIKVSHGLDVQQLNVANNINGVNVNDLFSKTMLYDKPQLVTGMKKFKQITIPHESNLDASTLSGYNFASLVEDAVYIDLPQNITGEKTFLAPNTYFKNVNFYKTFDGITNRTFRNNWLLQGVDQEIFGDLVLADLPGAPQKQRKPSIVIKGNLDIGGRLNGHDVRQLYSSIVKVNEKAIVRGSITFAGTVTADADVNLSGKIQGIKLSEEAVLRSQPNVRILGQKTFKSDIHVKDTVTVNGLLDGVLLSDLCDNAVRSQGNQHIRYPFTILGSAFSRSSLSSAGRVSGVDLRHFVKTCVHKDVNDVQVVSGKKHFKTLYILAPVTASAGFGGVDVTKLQNEYMSLTKNQLITTQMVFENGVSFHSDVLVDGNFNTLNGLIHMNGNAFNLSQISASTLKIHGDQEITGPVVFNDNTYFDRNVFIDNPMVSGIPFDWLVLRRSKRQLQFTAPIELDEVAINGNLMMADGARIHGVDVSRVRRSLVDSEKGSVNIRGVKDFSTVTVNDLILKGRLNGFFVDKSHILVSTPGVSQEIKARAVFNSVKVNSHLESSSINGVKLDQLSSRLVLNGVAPNTTITGGKTLAGRVTSGETWTMKLIDGLSIDNLGEAVYNRKLEEDALALEQRLTFHESKLQRISRFLHHQEQCVDHYTFTKKLDGRLVELSSTSTNMIATAKNDENGCADLNIHHLASNSPQVLFSKDKIVFNPNLVATIGFEGSSPTAIVSVSGSPVHSQNLPCIHQKNNRFAGNFIAQVIFFNSTLYSTVYEYPLDSIPYSMTILQNSPNEVCVIIAGHPNSNIICIGKRPALMIPLLTSRQHAVATVTDWHATFVASITSTEVRINEWDNVDRKLGKKVQVIILMTPEKESHSRIHFTKSINGDANYLIIAESKSAKVRGSRPLIRFFKRQPFGAVIHPFVEVQQVHEDENIMSISSLTSTKQELLFLLTGDFSVKVYRLQGASGWVKFDTLSLNSLASKYILSSGWSFTERNKGDGKSSLVTGSGSHWLVVSSDLESAIVETAIGVRPSH